MSNLVRVADYVAARLADAGLTDVFLVTGGGSMHLNDAFGRNKRLRYVACHHEQACAMAAEGYARLTGRPAIVNVTTGPGGTNAITGVWGAFVDSIPMVVVSGQVRFDTTVSSTGLPLRQLGDQEIDIVRVVESFTKYAVMVTDPASVRQHLERALHLAMTGRRGPVWLDIPMNIQGALVDAAALAPWVPPTDEMPSGLHASVQETVSRIRKASRPAILVGSGVRSSGMHGAFLRAIDRLGIPVTTGFNAHDAIWNDHPLYAGRPGLIGDRAGNFVVQNADVLLVLGSRLSIRQVSYAWKYFARAAYKIMVDVDEAELRKPTIGIDQPVHADLRHFFAALEAVEVASPSAEQRRWLAWCQERVRRFPVVLPEYWENPAPVNPYCFMASLFDALAPDDVVVCGDGTACVTSFQAARLQAGQRLFHNSGSAPMGYDLPASVGAAIATPGKRVICLAGDGSIQMNLQELQTISTHCLPIKIFVLNNKGYHSIRQTQQAYFPDNVVGCGVESGLGFPEMVSIAEAYGLPYQRIEDHAGMPSAIARALALPGAALCEVMLDMRQPFAPKVTSRRLPDGRMVSSPLEDMAPFLSREELRENMLIPLVEEDA